MSGKFFLFLVIATCITLIFWVATNILRTPPKSEAPAEMEQLLEPMPPNLDQEFINGI